MEWRRWIDAFRAKSRALLRRRQDNDDIHDELQFHLAMQTQLNLEKGMSDDEAAGGRASRLAASPRRTRALAKSGRFVGSAGLRVMSATRSVRSVGRRDSRSWPS